MTSSCVPPTEDPTEKMERNLELLFFKEQLRLVVRSNRSRTNPWRKEGNRDKEKRKFNVRESESFCLFSFEVFYKY